VSLRTLFRFLFLVPIPNMCTLLCADAAESRDDNLKLCRTASQAVSARTVGSY
jgi:hypothetical protein